MKTMECHHQTAGEHHHASPIGQIQTRTGLTSRTAPREDKGNLALSRPVAPRKLSWEHAPVAIFILVSGGILLIRPNSVSVRTLSLIFVSIVLEALPFMLLGAFLGGLIEAFVSRERLMSLLPKRGWVTVFVCGGLGCILPICECAVVPVVRRLGRKGLPPGAAIAYLLGGPVVNPIVLMSTAMAYNFDWHIALLRCGLGYSIAVGIGLLISRIFKGQSIFLDAIHTEGHSHSHEHHHGSGGCSCGHHCHTSSPTFRQKMSQALQHAASDFLTVGHYLVIGAFVAALAQTYIDRNGLLSITAYPVVPLLAMMGLAIALNLCSEADAFIAASLRGLMPLPAQMAFMLTGPIFDLKLLLMYQGVFRRRTILYLAGLILISVFVTTWILTAVWRAPA